MHVYLFMEGYLIFKELSSKLCSSTIVIVRCNEGKGLETGGAITLKNANTVHELHINVYKNYRYKYKIVFAEGKK